MNRPVLEAIPTKESRVQENLAKWQSSEDPLAPLTEEQMELVYEMGDLVSNLYSKTEDTKNEGSITKDTELKCPPVIHKMQDYIKWMIATENDIKHENLKQYQSYYEQLSKYQQYCKNLYTDSDAALNSLEELKRQYQNVTEKTNYLHDLSEQLMANQRVLKEKKQELNKRLKHFTYFSKCQESVERMGNRLNGEDCIQILDKIDESVAYLNDHLNYKESRIYKMKYESILNNLLNKIYNFVSNLLVETMKQVVDPEIKTHILPQAPNATDSLVDSAFSLYYGKFQSAASKVKHILQNLEEREEHNEQYKNILSDCQKTYLTQRLPILSVAVAKALHELKDKHKNDHSILFRSCSLFIMKVCQDEATCYNYFFSKISDLVTDYLGTLCQHLYDILRPNLITINHIEVLSELCGILRTELLNDRVVDSEQLTKYVEVITQLLHDVEERLVFRTNVFFQHDLLGYKPSPGDLAYPEKLLQMENIALDLRDRRSDSRSSVVSLESQEVAHINAAQMAHFRSYTGNSPADLHGMWYPTVKRTLVCLSRLYFCLDRNTFQGLAQEALVICIQTIQTASGLISSKKTPIDGQLFQIKHLLIIREQIAPFQVDFTVKETTLDFSTVQKAAVGLINHRNNIFTFGSNNALLEFLLEGTPKVKEYLVDSRKEIDKQLKLSCEEFISQSTRILVGSISSWTEKAEKILRIIQAENSTKQDLTVVSQDFGKPQFVSALIKDVQKNMKLRIPEIQRSMQLYLANRETEFILFRPIKNNVINAFMQVDQILLRGGYNSEDQLLIGCPSPEQVNVLICSVSLTSGQDSKSISS
ncbi:conserved oligomeric Golgi complex subunit 3 [Leptinotarsa decemlineata]|uniref:conserved oligomeric Golgi complex subunit 3 n=1 Tax=Leptinotarsa decemlineata TaxID=7539 RepID=UPI003D303FEF